MDKTCAFCLIVVSFFSGIFFRFAFFPCLVLLFAFHHSYLESLFHKFSFFSSHIFSTSKRWPANIGVLLRKAKAEAKPFKSCFAFPPPFHILSHPRKITSHRVFEFFFLKLRQVMKSRTHSIIFFAQGAKKKFPVLRPFAYFESVEQSRNKSFLSLTEKRFFHKDCSANRANFFLFSFINWETDVADV